MDRYFTGTFERIDSEKQRRILDAAAAEFASGGFAAANINVIANRAGVSVGSLYKYFGSKENCFLAVLEDGFSSLEQTLAEALDPAKTPQEMIRAILSLIPVHSRVHKSSVRLYNELTGDGLSERVKAFCERFESLSAQAYTELAQKLNQERGGSDMVDPAVLAFCMDNLFTMYQFSCACDYFELRKQVYLGAEKAENDQFLVDQMYRFILNGILGPGTSVTA